MALEKLEGVSGAYVDKGILILLDNEDPLDEKAVKAALTPLNIEVASVQQIDQLTF